MAVQDLNRNIKDFNPRFIPYVKFLLTFEYDRWKPFIVEGYRTHTRQQYLYEEGRRRHGIIRTYAKAWQSLHNYGMAVDIAFKDNMNLISRDKALYKRLYAYVKHTGMDWGGLWRWKDWGHFEGIISNLKSMSNVKLVKKKDSGQHGYYIPCTTEEALISLGKNFGKEIPAKDDHTVDWERVKVEGEFYDGGIDRV
jgi:hypothetical protein|tara:strand:+ start:3032 stop:3619 length:588 start_codon:yes stop_codon:yes gene_type:complete